MKTTLSIVSTLSALALSLALTACGDSEEAPASPAGGPPPAATTTTTAPTPTAPPPKRTMGTARAMGTRPENLVFDPMFGSFGTQYAATTLVQDAKGHVETPPTSPAGPAQPVMVASPDGAQPAFIMAVEAGTGPLDVRLYIATKDPTAPSVTLITPDGSGAFDVPASSAGAQKHGDRVYKLYSAHITDELFGRVYLLVEPKSEIVIAAPEVTSPAAPSTRGLTPGASRVALTPAAWKATRTLASLPLYRGLPSPPPAVLSAAARSSSSR